MLEVNKMDIKPIKADADYRADNLNLVRDTGRVS